MNKITFVFVLLMVFVVPFEEQMAIESFQSVTRLFGFMAIITGFFAVAIQGRIRRPPLTIIFLWLFWAWSVLSMGWTISSDHSLVRIPTYTALAIFVWLVWEFASTFPRQVLLIWAYIFGYCISLADQIFSFHGASLVQVGEEESRFAGGGLNANDLAYVGAVTIPLTLFLALRVVKNPILRLCCWPLVPLATLGIVLTGSRGGTIALVTAVSVLVFSLRRATWAFRIMFVAAGLLGAALVTRLAPEKTIERVTEGTESHTFQLRQLIWAAALERWGESPITGWGTGTFRVAVWGAGGGYIAHNAFLTILVETGLVGLGFFLGAALMTFYCVCRAPPEDRPFFWAILAVWFLASMVSPWEYSKSGWLMFSLVTNICMTLRATEGNRQAPRSPPMAVLVTPYGNSRLRHA